jgi:hypothetical protein
MILWLVVAIAIADVLIASNTADDLIRLQEARAAQDAAGNGKPT